MALSFQVRFKAFHRFNRIHHLSPSYFPITQSKHLPFIHTKFKSFSTKTTKDDSDDDIFEDIESEKDSKPKFDFEDDFDDFESFQKRKRNKSNDDTSNYYHEYFANMNREQQNTKSEDVKDRKRLKKPKGPRKTDKEREEDADMNRLKIEYRFIAAFIGGFCALTAYYFYYISGSKIGKADTYYKAAIDYELKIDTFGDNEQKEREECITNAEYYYKKAMKFTDYSFPKYLHKYAEFLLLYNSDYRASEHYITKALGLHSTNAIYHKFYCKLLKEQIEKNGQIERLQDYYSQKYHTIDAHMREAQYFLDEENNAKAAIMHFDYALNFCDSSLKNDDEENNDYATVKEDDMREHKMMTYQNAAQLLQEYGFNDEANEYWQDGIKEFGESLEVLFGVNLYENQKFDDAMSIFDKYAINNENAFNVTVNVMALAFKARILLEIGEYDEAMDIYSNILMYVGLDSMVIGDMIFILIQLNKLTDARNLMAQVIGLIQKREAKDDLMDNEEYNFINMIHVLLLGKLNEIETANYQCLEMVNKYPNSFEVNYIAALYYDECAKNYDKADRYYRTAISIEPKWAKVYYNYALFFKKNNDLGQFAKYIKIAYEKNDKIPHINALYNEYFDDEGRLLHNVAL